MRDLQEDRLAVASKSVVIATTSSIAKQVVSSLARHDVHIQEASQAKDLGLDVSSSKKAKASNHGQEAGRRTRSCATLGKWTSNQASARLWRTGAWPQKTYGTAAVGAPPTWIKQARTGSTMRRSRQVSNHDNRTPAPRHRPSCSDPESHQAVAHLLGAQPQTQGQDWQSLGEKLRQR